ncbi:MAG: class I SAM-dependent methyltransferase [Patescibacteria group bacterium]
MLISIVILFIIITIIFLFSSKILSPIPYFPSQPVDMPLIIKALSLKNNQTIFDLGAGDGIVIFKAAQQAYQQKLNTQFVAVEINPVLILILYLRRLFHQNRKNIKIVHDDIFKMDFSFYNRCTDAKFCVSTTFYLYISPWYLEKTISNIKDQISKFSVISYMYPIGSLKNKQKILQGKNKIFIY